MTNLFEKVNTAVVEAAKNKDSARLLILRTLVSDIRNVAKKACREEVVDDDVMGALVKGVKQREDSITQFKAAGREDLVENETFQVNVLKEFLPAQLGEDEVRRIVVETVERIANGGTKSKKLMGMIMKELNPELKGKADMKFVSSILSELLV